jgi:acetyl esterase
MPTVDDIVGGVPVRRYQPGRALTIVYLHGGAFVFGDLDTHDAQVRRLAAGTGASVVAVDYRRAPEHPFPAAVDDAQTVLDSLDGDVAVAGDSAGGLIAALVTERRRERITAMLLVCPNTDLRTSDTTWIPDPADRTAASPLAREPAQGMPPTLIVTAEHDDLRDEGDAYAELLRNSGALVVHRKEAGLPHNFPTLRHQSPAAKDAEDRFIADARAILSGAGRRS